MILRPRRSPFDHNLGIHEIGVLADSLVDLKGGAPDFSPMIDVPVSNVWGWLHVGRQTFWGSPLADGSSRCSISTKFLTGTGLERVLDFVIMSLEAVLHIFDIYRFEIEMCNFLSDFNLLDNEVSAAPLCEGNQDKGGAGPHSHCGYLSTLIGGFLLDRDPSTL